MELEEQAQRGEQARKLLEHPLLAEAFQIIEQDITDKWQNSPARDSEGRERLWTQLKLLHRLRGELELVVENGKAAEATLLQQLQAAGRRIWNG
jgi:hypothetical protein